MKMHRQSRSAGGSFAAQMSCTEIDPKSCGSCVRVSRGHRGSSGRARCGSARLVRAVREHNLGGTRRGAAAGADSRGRPRHYSGPLGAHCAPTWGRLFREAHTLAVVGPVLGARPGVRESGGGAERSGRTLAAANGLIPLYLASASVAQKERLWKIHSP